MSMRWLTYIRFAQHVWALPFLTALAPSERHSAEQGRAVKKFTDWARQRVFQVRRWLPKRDLVVGTDSACARLVRPVTVITRWRLEAALDEPAPAYCGKGRAQERRPLAHASTAHR